MTPGAASPLAGRVLLGALIMLIGLSFWLAVSRIAEAGQTWFAARDMHGRVAERLMTRCLGDADSPEALAQALEARWRGEVRVSHAVRESAETSLCAVWGLHFDVRIDSEHVGRMLADITSSGLLAPVSLTCASDGHSGFHCEVQIRAGLEGAT